MERTEGSYTVGGSVNGFNATETIQRFLKKHTLDPKARVGVSLQYLIAFLFPLFQFCFLPDELTATQRV